VIARNSSFVYKGRAVDVKQVSRELGVRYVVEGSVRRSGDRVRITAQLVDATTGAHVWAERYDRELRDVFALQDEITEAIAGAMRPGLWQFEQERARRAPPRNLAAWELAQRGWWHFWRISREDFVRAREFFERALELDPDLAWACSGLALVCGYAVMLEFSASPVDDLRQALALAQRSAELDSSDFFSQLALGAGFVLTGQPEELVPAAERALQLNPSLPLAHMFLGRMRVFTGHPDEGLEHIEKAMRLSPRDPLFPAFLANRALADFAAGRYEEAVEWGRRAQSQAGGGPPVLREGAAVVLAAALAMLDRVDEARAALEGVREEFLRIGVMSRVLGAIADEDFLQRFTDGLRKAGLPED
jgi:tetratricopeptide (TPR) repeat protein